MSYGRNFLPTAIFLVFALPCGAEDGATAFPVFDVATEDGSLKTVSEFFGAVTIVNFWATWCGPCIKEIPEYAEFWRKNQTRGVEVVGVVMESGSPDEILDFIREYKIPYRQLLGDDEIASEFGVNQGLPTTFVIDGEGVIRSKILGSPPTKFEKLQETVDAALAG